MFRIAIRQLPRPVLGACLVLLCAAAGCGDDFADPIVRAAGASGSGSGSMSDGGNEGPADLCSPCGGRSDCATGEACVALSRGANRFCSRACGNGNERCPSGYDCKDVYSTTSPACVPEGGDCGRVVY